MKMPQKFEKELVAICGMNCAVCYKHLAKRRTVNPCNGCWKDDETVPGHCRKCRIKTCAKEKNLRYCFECCEYPCGWIQNLDRSYRKRYQVSLIQNGTEIKEQGICFFLEQEQERFQCDQCSGVVSLHDQLCSECGKHFEQIDSTIIKEKREV